MTFFFLRKTDNDLGKDKWVLEIDSQSSFERNRGILRRWWEFLGSWVVGRLMWRPLFFRGLSQCKWWNLLLSWTAYVDDHQVRLLMSSFETLFFFWLITLYYGLPFFFSFLFFSFFCFLFWGKHYLVYLFCRVVFGLDKLGLRAVVSDCKYRKKNINGLYNGLN